MELETNFTTLNKDELATVKGGMFVLCELCGGGGYYGSMSFPNQNSYTESNLKPFWRFNWKKP